MSPTNDNSANKHPHDKKTQELSPQLNDNRPRQSSSEIIATQLVSGEFFTPQERENLLNATYALHGILPPTKILNGLAAQFIYYSSSQQLEALNFLKNYFNLDSNSYFIPIHKKGSKLIKAFNNFYQQVEAIAKEPIIKEKLIELQNLIMQKIKNKKYVFFSELDNISRGSCSTVELFIMTNTILFEVERNKYDKAKLDEYYFTIVKIANAPNLGALNLDQRRQLQVALTKVFGKVAEFLPEAEGLQQLRQQIKDLMVVPTVSQDEEKEQYVDLSSLKVARMFDGLGLNILSTIQYEQALEMFVNNLEYGFTKFLSTVDLNELRELAWLKEEDRIKNNLTLLAPNVYLYFQYLNLSSDYLIIHLLYKEDEEHNLIYREDIRQIKNIAAFLQQALIKALNKEALATAHTIYYALKNSALARLPFLADVPDYRERFKTLSSASKGVPFLPFIQQELVKAYNKKSGTHFEKRIIIGKILKEFEERRQAAVAKILTHDNLFPQFMIFFKRHYLLEVLKSGNHTEVNQAAVGELMQRASYDLLPDTFKEYELRNFTSLTELISHLQYCYNRQIDFHLTKKFPERDIVKFIVEIVQTDDDLSLFNEAMNTLELINKINIDQARTYKTYDSDLVEILNCYQLKIVARLRNPTLESIDLLEHFFDGYHNNGKIKAILNGSSEILNPFSAEYKARSKINNIENLHELFRKQLAQVEILRSQQAYSQLLIDILEDREPTSLLQLTPPNNGNLDNLTRLLPDSEFEVPTAEPEHPDRIGVNRIMTFNPQKEKPSVLETFKTDELIFEFLYSFPWATDVDHLAKLTYAQCDPEINLLGTDNLLEAKLQLAVIKYILSSLDALGKIAGFKGETALENFNDIKSITDNLHEISELITIPHVVHTPEFEAKLSHYTQAIVKLNKEYFDFNNTEMNGFCHINEQLAYILMGVDYYGSILIPNIPEPFYLEIINESLHPVKKAKRRGKGKPHATHSSEARH